MTGYQSVRICRVINWESHNTSNARRLGLGSGDYSEQVFCLDPLNLVLKARGL